MKKILALLIPLLVFSCQPALAALKAVVPLPNTVTSSGNFTSGNCVQFSTSGSSGATVSDAGAACGTGGGGTPGGAFNSVQYNAAGSFGGFTFSGDCTLVVGTGAITCTKTSGNAFGTLATQNGTFSGTSSGTNTGDVTLAGENYLSIASQVITANAVNLSGTHVTGTLAAARFGALTGDITNSAGSYATTVAKIAGTTVSGTTGSTNVVFSNSPTLVTPVLGAATATSITAPAFISNNADPADAGIVRLGNAENIAWEANPTGTDLTITMDANNVLTSSVAINATTGFRIGNAAASGKFLVGNGTNYVASTSTIPTSAGATANKVLLSDGTNYVLSTPTFPNASATSGKTIRSDGTNWIASTATLSDAPSTALKWLRSDGTNWITSTSTLSDSPSTAGKVVVSDGTNWITSTPTFPNASATSGKTIRSDGTNWVASTATLSDAPSTSLKWLRSDGTNWITSTSTLSDSPSTAGKVVVSDGTNWITSTPTFPNASATSGKAIISDGTNWVASSSLFGQVGGTYLGDAVTGNQTIVLVQYAPYAFTINTLKNLGTVAGTVTGALKINGTNVTGCNALALTSTPAASTTCSGANVVAAGDLITFVTTSASSLTGLLAFSMIGTRS